MEYGLIIWLGCGALAVIVVLWARATHKKKEEPIELNDIDRTISRVVNFSVQYFGAASGWHGNFDKTRNGVLLRVNEENFKTGDTVRAIVRSMHNGLWQLEPIKLSHLKDGYVIATGEKKNGWLCLYPNKYGYAMVGVIETSQPLKANKKYAVKKESDGVFTLI